jgi:hypothetical protein
MAKDETGQEGQPDQAAKEAARNEAKKLVREAVAEELKEGGLIEELKKAFAAPPARTQRPQSKSIFNTLFGDYGG